MSVVCCNPIDGITRVFVKGSPEKLQLICDNQSIPDNFHSVLEEYTREGFRVIALAWK